MNVRVIPTSIHGTIDHGVAPTLLAAPAIFRLRDDSPEALVARVVGGMQAVYANLTDYEMSLKNFVPMPVHLALDGLGAPRSRSCRSSRAHASVGSCTGSRTPPSARWRSRSRS